jgi:hypothetical protein
VGGTGVLVAVGVFVGGTGVAVGGTGVLVGVAVAVGVLVGVGVGAAKVVPDATVLGMELPLVLLTAVTR